MLAWLENSRASLEDCPSLNPEFPSFGQNLKAAWATEVLDLLVVFLCLIVCLHSLLSADLFFSNTLLTFHFLCTFLHFLLLAEPVEQPLR